MIGWIGDIFFVGVGFWVEEWVEEGDFFGYVELRCWFGLVVVIFNVLKGFMVDCLFSLFSYNFVFKILKVVIMWVMVVLGIGNGDLFFCIVVVRIVGVMVCFGGVLLKEVVLKVVGLGGELEKSVGDWWGLMGEGVGGIIGIEIVEVWDDNGMLFDVCCGVF